MVKKGGKSILLSSLLLMQWEEKALVCFGGKGKLEVGEEMVWKVVLESGGGTG